MTDIPREQLRDGPRTRIPARSPGGVVRRAGVGLLLTVGLVALAAGGAVVVRDAAVPATGEVAVVSDATEALAVEYVDAPPVQLVNYEHGATVSYAIELRNDGPVPVTVEDLPLGPMDADRRLVRPIGVRVLPDGAHATDAAGGATPFEPFRLERGVSRTVIVDGVFDNCAYYTERAMDLIASQAVTWSIAGLSTTTDVDLSRQLAVRSPHIRHCPGRVMDRGARTRSGVS